MAMMINAAIGLRRYPGGTSMRRALLLGVLIGLALAGAADAAHGRRHPGGGSGGGQASLGMVSPGMNAGMAGRRGHGRRGGRPASADPYMNSGANYGTTLRLGRALHESSGRRRRGGPRHRLSPPCR